MFHPFLPDPHVITVPGLAENDFYEYELVPALDVSNYKTGALVFRVHGTLSTATIQLLAYKIWPFSDAVGVRFQDSTAIISTNISAVTTTGVLVTTDTDPDATTPLLPIGAPAIRIVAKIKASTGAISANAVVTISAGIVLLD